LKEVVFLDNYPHKNTGGFYIHKTVTKPKKACPFLKDNLCSIHDTKPVACKDAPYGYSEFPNCPAFDEAKEDIAEHYAEVTRRQRDDFYRAFTQYRHLIKLLAFARRMS
jgi:Fe-S-cluster containining protein